MISRKGKGVVLIPTDAPLIHRGRQRSDRHETETTGPLSQIVGTGSAMAAPHRPWYERYPERSEQERAEMKAEGFALNEEALRNEQRVEFRGPSRADPRRLLTVKYPEAFPSMPPRVYLDGGQQLPQRHYNPNTLEICLFGPGQTRWSASLPGRTAVDEANQVINLFALGQLAPLDDQVPEPMTAAFQYTVDAAFLVPPGVSTPDIGSGSELVKGTFRFRFQRRSFSRVPSYFPGRGVVLETNLNGTVAHAEEFYRQTFVTEGETRHAPLLYLPQPPPSLRTFEDLKAWLEGLGLKRQEWMAFLFNEESLTADRRRLAWLILHTKAGKFHTIRTFTLRPDEREVRVPGTRGLANKKVVIVGCGSLGSKIAVALAATGLSRFVLVDPDFLEPYNSVRHEVGVENFGTLKVTAVLNRIFAMNPWASEKEKWDGLPHVIGGADEVPHAKRLWEHIGDSDLVIETTGVHGVSRYINDLCYELTVPALIASVTNGAWAGEIVRAIPGETACWQCWNEQFREQLPPAAPAPDPGVFAPGCDQPTFTGTTYEVGMVANIAAMVAVETLLHQEQGRKHFAADYVRWIGRDAGGESVLHADFLAVRPREYCPVCNPQ